MSLYVRTDATSVWYVSRMPYSTRVTLLHPSLSNAGWGAGEGGVMGLRVASAVEWCCPEHWSVVGALLSHATPSTSTV